MKTKLVLAAAMALAALGITLIVVDPQQTSAQSAEPASSAPAPEKVGNTLVLDEALWRDIVAAEEVVFNKRNGCAISAASVREMAEALAEETGMYYTFTTDSLVKRERGNSTDVRWLKHEGRNKAGATLHYGLISDTQQPEKWRLATFPMTNFPGARASAYALASVELSDAQANQLLAENYFQEMQWFHPLLHKANLDIKLITVRALLDTYLYTQPKLQFIAAQGGEREVRVESGKLSMYNALSRAVATVGGSIENEYGKPLSNLNVNGFKSWTICELMQKEVQPWGPQGARSITSHEEAIAYMKESIEKSWDDFSALVIVKLPN